MLHCFVTQTTVQVNQQFSSSTFLQVKSEVQPDEQVERFAHAVVVFLLGYLQFFLGKWAVAFFSECVQSEVRQLNQRESAQGVLSALS